MAYERKEWSYSGQKGTPGHCFQAQVWDENGDSLAIIDPKEDPKEATAIARTMALAPSLLEDLRNILQKVEDGSTIEDEILEVYVEDAKQTISKVYGTI